MEQTDHTCARFHLLHNRRLILTVLILTESYICFGYDGSVIGGILAMPAFIQRFGTELHDGSKILTASQISIITAIRVVGSIPGTWACHYLGNKWGRRRTLWFGCGVCLVGTAIQTGAVDVAMLTMGLITASFGYFTMVSMSSTLIIEISPPSIRGAAGALAAGAIGVTGILSSGVNWAMFLQNVIFSVGSISWRGCNIDSPVFSRLPDRGRFRVPLGLQNLFPVLAAVSLLYVMDSPTSYLINGDDANAEKSLRLVRRGYSEHEIALEMETLRHQNRLRKQEDNVQWYEIFKGTDLRRTLLGTFLGVIQNVSGAIFAGNYATIFLSQVGTANPFVLVFGLNLLCFGGSVLGIFLVDSIGRRPLMLLSFLLLAIIDLVIGCLGFADPTNVGVIKSIAGFSLLFGFVCYAGLGPLTWLVSAELPTARLRNISNAWILLTISLSNLAVTYILPYIANADAGNLGPKTYLIFAFCMTVGLVVTFLYWPECKGRSPAELDEMFKARLPARKFKSYKATVITESMEVFNAEEGKLGENIAIEKVSDKEY